MNASRLCLVVALLLLGCGPSRSSAKDPEPPISDPPPTNDPTVADDRSDQDQPAAQEPSTETESTDPNEPSHRLRSMSPFERGSRLPTRADLSGVWHEVPDTAPRGPFRRLPPCFEGLGWVALEQHGERVAMLRTFPQPSQGYLPREYTSNYERGAGSRHGDQLELDAELIRATTPSARLSNGPLQTRRTTLGTPHWTLRFDQASGHLIGTRDKEAVRLAPLVLVDPPANSAANRCGSPPP